MKKVKMCRPKGTMFFLLVVALITDPLSQLRKRQSIHRQWLGLPVQWSEFFLFHSFALQIVASWWWLRRFQFGPFERLWRSLTYWKKQPMRLKQEIKEAL